MNASSIHAVSMDWVSTFWTKSKNRRKAEDYISSQPSNTIRLFVFSSPREANYYRQLLQANHNSYGNEGRVYICSKSSYNIILNSMEVYGSASLSDSDFGILSYENDDITIEALLDDSTLGFKYLDLHSEHPYNRWVNKLDELKRLDYQTLYKHVSPDGIAIIKRWNPNCVDDNTVWADDLTSLFPGEISGEVYHIVLFRKDEFGKLESAILQVRNELRSRLKTLGIDSVWLGVTPEKHRVSDFTYRGELSINADYDYALVIKCSDYDSLKKYYSNKPHSAIRTRLYRSMSSGLDLVYRFMDDFNENTNFSNITSEIFENVVERLVSSHMIRCDFIEKEDINSIVQERPYQFSYKHDATDT